MLEPLFEFSGACAGCGETPYLKLVTQLFGDRMIVANATGCSSIYGGQPPDHPVEPERRGPRPGLEQLALRGQRRVRPRHAPRASRPRRAWPSVSSGPSPPASTSAWSTGLLDADQTTEPGIVAQRDRVADLRAALEPIAAGSADDPTDGAAARHLLAIADTLVRTGVWIVGGDGWAYDIGFNGLDHVLASGRNVNMLVLDTEVYSNTGGQASKATPRSAVAKFAAGGKSMAKKDLGATGRVYGNVYVAQIAMGANDLQATKALLEADAWPGPSLVIAYSTCIAHGIDMSTSMSHQKDAVRSGYWPLYRFHPSDDARRHPVPPRLQGRRRCGSPTSPRRRSASPCSNASDPERARELAALLQADVDERWHYYTQMAGLERSVPHVAARRACPSPVPRVHSTRCR